MNNLFSRFLSLTSASRTAHSYDWRTVALAVAITLLSSGLHSSSVANAQKLREPVKISEIGVQSQSSGTTVTIQANDSINRNQVWQDTEGYHLVVPNAVAAESVKKLKGVKVRNLGSSLEILVQTKAGAKVQVQPDTNRITLMVDGPLRSHSNWEETEPQTFEEQMFFDDAAARRWRSETAPLKFGPPSGFSVDSAVPNAVAQNNTSQSTQPPPVPQASQQSTPPANSLAQSDAGSTIQVYGEDESILASVFSGTSVLVIVSLGLVGLLVSRKLRSRQNVAVSVETPDEELQSESNEIQTASFESNGAAMVKSIVPVGPSVPTNGNSKQSIVRMPVAGPTTLYGAYRIDQEVGKLLLGQPHRLDVLSSRASDDRRAIEASLIKGVNATELDEGARKRAREALEEYGFVARQCASLLLAGDAFDRASAARSLGDIKSGAALPFLLEALYDSEPIVRNQAVVSIGELKIPSAIGALLDIARTHPDVPSNLLSRTLSACTVEGLDFFDAMPLDPAMLGTGFETYGIEDITKLEEPAPVDALPEDSDDAQFVEALAMLESEDPERRSDALKTLGQFQVLRGVNAIARLASADVSPNIRAQAIASLGSINHESVFTAIVIGMGDETREVRAAAARSLNRLSFNRADAYARVIEANDTEVMQLVAKACLQSGIVSQNLDRLAQVDREHAYETFTLICLLARAGMCDPVLDAVLNHSNNEVRIKVIHLLGCTGQPEIFEKLREFAVNDDISEEVKNALLNAMYKLDQAKRQETSDVPTAATEQELPLENSPLALTEFITEETPQVRKQEGEETPLDSLDWQP